MYKQSGKNVVIIDEYDKPPLLDTMTNSLLHKAMRDKRKGFYGMFKPSERFDA